MTWQPRYVAYAKAHGRTADEQHAHDDKNYTLCNFSFWIEQQLVEAERAGHRSVTRFSHIGLRVWDQIAWDEWLNRPDATKLVER